MSAEWLTSEEAAVRARRHVVTVRRAFEDGTLHGHQTQRGGRLSFRPSAVDAWVTGLDGAAACGCPRLKIARVA